MKKILLTVCMAVVAVTMNAQLADNAAGTYTGDLDVFFIQQFPTSENISVSIEKADDTHINFSLKNFVLGAGEDVLPVGNIALSNIELIQLDDSIKFQSTETIEIAAGDMDGFEAGDWMGPNLGKLDVTISGKVVGDSAIIEPITIPLEGLGMVSVSFKGKNANPNNIGLQQNDKIGLVSTVVSDVISLSGVNDNVNYAIYNITGALVKSGSTTGTINVSTLNKGIYLIKVGTTTTKFIKK